MYTKKIWFFQKDKSPDCRTKQLWPNRNKAKTAWSWIQVQVGITQATVAREMIVTLLLKLNLTGLHKGWQIERHVRAEGMVC